MMWKWTDSHTHITLILVKKKDPTKLDSPDEINLTEAFGTSMNTFLVHSSNSSKSRSSPLNII